MTPVGIDVAKATLEVSTPEQHMKVNRTREAAAELMRSLPGDALIALEATGRYHRLVVEAAAAAGLEVRLVDPHAFSHYRRSLHPRAKTDRLDAAALRRYAEKEAQHLRPAAPSTEQMQRLKDLLELRETQVKHATAWALSLREQEQVPPAARQALKLMKKSIAALDAEIRAIAGQHALYQRLLKVDGLGPCTAPALVWLLQSKGFTSSDALVAFVGMDVAVRQSGKFEGRRKLTKRGPAFIRRLLYCAAGSLRRISAFAGLFRKHHAKGLRAKAVNIVVARRILRTAFHLAAHPEWQYSRDKMLGST